MIQPIFVMILLFVAATEQALAASLVAGALQPNDLVITEYLANPVGVSDAEGEYFEIYNTTSATVDLTGLVVRDDGSNQFELGALMIAPMTFAVLSSADGAGLGFVPDFIYGSAMALTNTDDEIGLYRPDDTLIFKAVYDDGDFFGAGIAHELARLDGTTAGIATGPTAGADFIAATTALDNGNLGSPGFAGNTRIELPVVPLPPAFWLFGAALGTLAWIRRAAVGDAQPGPPG